MSSLSQALRLEYLPSSHSAFQGHAVHIIEWPTMLRPKDSAGTCIPAGVTTFLQSASRRSPSTGRTGRQPAQGRAHGGRKHTGRLRAPRSGSGKCGPRPCQLDRQPQCCRTGQPATASEQAALNTAHERGLQGPDRVRETTVVVVGVFPVRVPPQKRASTVPNAGADPWSWIAASVATRDPSDGSGPDRSCLDDG